MNLQQINIGQLVAQIFALIATLVGYALLLLIFSKVVQIFGHPIPYVPAISEVALAYVCGAWWLYRK
jgi:hypothetical protein